MHLKKPVFAGVLTLILIAVTAQASDFRPIPAPPVIGAKSYLMIDLSLIHI